MRPSEGVKTFYVTGLLDDLVYVVFLRRLPALGTEEFTLLFFITLIDDEHTLC